MIFTRLPPKNRTALAHIGVADSARGMLPVKDEILVG
jgi:hypothetical protein